MLYGTIIAVRLNLEAGSVSEQMVLGEFSL